MQNQHCILKTKEDPTIFYFSLLQTPRNEFERILEEGFWGLQGGLIEALTILSFVILLGQLLSRFSQNSGMEFCKDKMSEQPSNVRAKFHVSDSFALRE